jgi:hypothetical protein
LQLLALFQNLLPLAPLEARKKGIEGWEVLILPVVLKAVPDEKAFALEVGDLLRQQKQVMQRAGLQGFRLLFRRADQARGHGRAIRRFGE